jgi:hypothetical protein
MLQWSCPHCALTVSSVSVGEHLDAIAEHTRGWHDAVPVPTHTDEGIATVLLAQTLDHVTVGQPPERVAMAVGMFVAALIDKAAGADTAIAGGLLREFEEAVDAYVAALRARRALTK